VNTSNTTASSDRPDLHFNHHGFCHFKDSTSISRKKTTMGKRKDAG
jgi:hypothetical protein